MVCNLSGVTWCAFDSYQNPWPWMTLSCYKFKFSRKFCATSHFWEATTATRMKIDPYYQQQKCSPMILVSGNIRRMRIFILFTGVPLAWATAGLLVSVVPYYNLCCTCLLQLSKVRMSVPCRSSSCHHLQCFDAATYLQMNEKKPTWLCPVCDKPAEYSALIIDG